VDPTAGLDVCEKSRPHRDSIPGPSSPYPVAIPTELPGPRISTQVNEIQKLERKVEGIVHVTSFRGTGIFFFNQI
jgi:hypothetical protein